MQEAEESKEVFYYEHARTLVNRVGRMLTKSELSSATGFRSIYGFDTQATLFFREASTTKGAKHFKVFADELFMDFDDNPAECERVVNALLADGLGVEVWDTGGRGQHVVVRHQPLYSRHLPYSQKIWVKNKGFNVDFCLYSHGHIIRLPNTRHSKTGGYKTLVFSQEGTILDLPLIEAPVRALVGETGEFDPLEIVSLLSRFASRPPVNGERNHRFFALAVGLIAYGLEVATMEDLVRKFNDTIDEPLEEEELVLLLESAVTTLGG